MRKKKEKKVFDWKLKNSLMVLCFSMLFVVSLLLSGSNTANAAISNNWHIQVISPLEQVVRLENPTAAAPGGRGFMIPQEIYVSDEAGRPVINAPVTFEVSSNPVITSLMRGTYSKKITVYTNIYGIASAANTHADFLGEGFQVYSEWPGIKQTLQVTASVPGLNNVTFDVIVKTYGYKY